MTKKAWSSNSTAQALFFAHGEGKMPSKPLKSLAIVVTFFFSWTFAGIYSFSIGLCPPVFLPLHLLTDDSEEIV